MPFSGQANAYDPLQPLFNNTGTVELSVIDIHRDRNLPLLVYVPDNTKPQPIVLFSHGLGGSRYGSSYLGKHWAARGYIAVFLQHPGSDETVWKDKPMLGRMRAMRQAASAENFKARVEDVKIVLNQLEVWNGSKNHALYNRLDLERIGMSGHSFGAMTTQAIGGQNFPQFGTAMSDPRIMAALAFSPSAPRRGGSPEEAFGAVTIPWMLMTGTNDNAPIGDADAASRLEVYKSLPHGDKYELVLADAEHSAFTDKDMPRKSSPRNPNHHRAILALSTAFWDSILKSDHSAQSWLTGKGARSVLEPDDRWQFK